MWRGAQTNPWVEASPAHDRSWLPDLLADPTDSVFVEAGARDPLEEALWVDSLEWPNLRAIVAGIVLVGDLGVPAQLDRLASISRLAGVRHQLQDESPDFFTDPKALAALRDVAAAGLTFDACVSPHQLASLTRLIVKVPELNVVLDHLGNPPLGSADMDVWAADLQALATLMNVKVKLSGRPVNDDPRYPPKKSSRRALNHAIQLFGPERSMLGSDWPMSAPYAELSTREDILNRVVESTGLSGHERDALLRTGEMFYQVRR